MSEKSLLN